jgi:hypothetical protein
MTKDEESEVIYFIEEHPSNLDFIVQQIEDSTVQLRALETLEEILRIILRVWPSWCPLPPGFQEECTITLIGTGPEGLN